MPDITVELREVFVFLPWESRMIQLIVSAVFVYLCNLEMLDSMQVTQSAV